MAGIVDTSGDYAGVTVRVVVVDFRSMQLQQFAVDELGRVGAPIGVPVDCTAAALAASQRIRVHRDGN